MQGQGQTGKKEQGRSGRIIRIKEGQEEERAKKKSEWQDDQPSIQNRMLVQLDSIMRELEAFAFESMWAHGRSNPLEAQGGIDARGAYEETRVSMKGDSEGLRRLGGPYLYVFVGVLDGLITYFELEETKSRLTYADTRKATALRQSS